MVLKNSAIYKRIITAFIIIIKIYPLLKAVIIYTLLIEQGMFWKGNFPQECHFGQTHSWFLTSYCLTTSKKDIWHMWESWYIQTTVKTLFDSVSICYWLLLTMLSHTDIWHVWEICGIWTTVNTLFDSVSTCYWLLLGYALTCMQNFTGFAPQPDIRHGYHGYKSLYSSVHNTPLHVCACAWVSVHVCVHACMHVCMCVCVYLCVCQCVHACVRERERERLYGCVCQLGMCGGRYRCLCVCVCVDVSWKGGYECVCFCVQPFKTLNKWIMASNCQVLNVLL